MGCARRLGLAGLLPGLLPGGQALVPGHGSGALLRAVTGQHLLDLHPGQQHPAAIETFQELDDSYCLARKKNRQLEGIKNSSKKNLFSHQLLLTGGFEGGKEEDQMERSQPHACPLVQCLGMGISYTTS